MGQRETISGSGAWKVVFYDGVAMRVEVAQGDRLIVVGHQIFDSTCARCGTAIKTTSPDNDDLDCCLACTELIAAEVEQERHG